MRLIPVSLTALGAALMTSPAMACAPLSAATAGCTLPLTIVPLMIVNDGDGFTIVPRDSLPAALPGAVAHAPLSLPLRLGGAVWFDDQLARFLTTPSPRPERGQ
jgi:hypothetical protein